MIGDNDKQEITKPIDPRKTNYILLLEDSIHTGSAIGRLILIACGEIGRSCGLYHLGSAVAPQLTYYEAGNSPKDPKRNKPSQQSSLEFAVYVAATHRHALAWIENTRPTNLTFIVDATVKTDADINLANLVELLATHEIPTQFFFTSAVPQTQAALKTWLEQRKSFFIVKQSPEWEALPKRLVDVAAKPNYYIPKKTDHQDLAPPRRAAVPATSATPAQA